MIQIKPSPFLALLFALAWFIWLWPATNLWAQTGEPILTIDNGVSSPTTALDAGDTVTYIIRIAHKQVVQNGNVVDLSLGDAFNVDLVTLLPTNLSNVIIASALITDGVNPPIDVTHAFTLDSNNQLLTTTAITLEQATAGPTKHQSLTLLVSGQIDNNIHPSDALPASEAYLTWKDAAGQLLATYQASSSSAALPITGVLNVNKTVSAAEAAIGSLITYSLTVSVIEGTTVNLHFIDTLAPGLTYEPGSFQVADANGMTITGVNATAPTANRLDILLAAVTNPGDVNNALTLDTDPFVLTYQAHINNKLTNQGGVSLPNDVDVTANGVASDLNNKVILKVTEPKLRIAKAAANSTPKIGETVLFTITVDHEKASNATAYDLVITDTIPAGMIYVPGSASLPAAQVNETGNPEIVFSLPTVAEHAVISFTYAAIVAAPGDSLTSNLPGVTRTNQLFATWTSQPDPAVYERTGTGGGNDYYVSAAATITVTNPDLQLYVTGSDLMANPGSLFTYTLHYANAGNHLATGVVLTASIPAQTVFHVGASTPGWVCMPNYQPGSVCSFSIGALNGYASSSKRFVVTVNPAPFAAGINQIDSYAGISDDGANGVEPTPANNHAQITTTLNVAPNLQISLSDGGIDAPKGKVFTYTLGYTNAGNQDATGVVITETVPANSVFQPAASTPGWVCAPNNQANSHCHLGIGTLNSGAAQVATFAVTVVDPVPAGVLTLENTAVIGDDGNNGVDSQPANNQVSLTTPIILSVDLTMSQQPGPTPLLAGDIFTHQLTIRNQGPDAATGVVVTDTLPEHVTYLGDNCGVGINLAPWVWPLGNLESDATATCTITITVAASSTATLTNVVQVANLVYELLPDDNSTTTATAVLPPLRINEVDYDQPGVDTAEFIELKNTGLISINLSSFWVDLVDGASGAALVYRSLHLPTVDLAPGGYYVLCGNAATTPNCDLDMPEDTNRIQDGAPDAIAVRLGNTLVDLLSYGGDTLAPYTEGVGATPGDNNTVAALGLARTPDGHDTRNNQADFQLRCVSPGTANLGVATQCAPQVTIHKMVSPTLAAPGQPVTYTLTFSNSGNAYLPATNVVITDLWPTQLNSLITIGGNVALTQTGNAPIYAWQTVDLWPGSTGVITITGQVTDLLTADTTVTNSAKSMNSNVQPGQLPANSAAPLLVSLPRVGFSAASYSVVEASGAALITVTLATPNPYAAVTVSYASSDGSATVGSDYPSFRGTLTIPAGRQSVTLTVPISDDLWVEDDESLHLLLTAPVGAVLGGTTTATLTVIDDDAATVSIGDATYVEGNVGQTAVFSFTVSLSHPSAQPVALLATTADGTATHIDDYSPLTAFPVTFPPGILTRTVSVAVLGDRLVEYDETFMVNLASATFGGAADPSRITIADSQGISTIQNDDQAGLSISDGAQIEGNTGATLMTLTVALSNPVSADVTVQLMTLDGSAHSGSDYTAVNTQIITFTAGGALTQTVSVPLLGELLVEHDETFSMSLTNATFDGAGQPALVAITDDAGVGLIQNDDAVDVTIDDVQQSEGNSGVTAYTFTVRLSAPIAADVTVAVNTLAGSAAGNGVDYGDIVSQIITFTAGGPESQAVAVGVSGEALVEKDETFGVELSQIQFDGALDSSRATSSDALGAGVINNDDSATLRIADGAQLEGKSGSAYHLFTVTLDSAVDTAVTVGFSTTDGSATVGDADYVATAGVITFTGNAGETQPFTVTLNGDTKVELDETFIANLSNVQADDRAVTLDDSQGMGMILNDDSAALQISDAAIAEDATGGAQLVFTVTLDAAVDAPLTLTFATADSSATTSDTDYQTASGALTFTGALGETQTITVSVNGDQKVELDEQLWVNLSNLQASGRAVSLGDSQGVGAIVNDDQALLAINDIVAAEGAAGTRFYTFTVQLNAAVDTLVTVDFATGDASAQQSNNDYLSAAGALIFAGAVGETHQLTVAVQGDALVELDEIFVVNLSNIQAGGRAVSLGDSQGEAYIPNDDSALVYIEDVSQAEGNPGDPLGATRYTFTVTLGAAVDAPVTVAYNTADETAQVSDHDYIAATGMITFTGAAGEQQTIVALVQGDEIVEQDEHFQLLLSNPQASGRAVALADAQGMGAIVNDDLASFVIGDVTAAEGNKNSINYSFVISLSHPVAESVSVTVNTADGSASGNRVDYRSLSNQVLLFTPHGALTQTVAVRVTGETTVEYDETFTVNLSNPLFNGASDASRLTIANGEGLGLILNDDIAAVTIDDVSQAEGDGATTLFTFTLTLSNPVAKDVTVQVQTAANRALGSAVDYHDLSTSLVTFRPNSVQTRRVSVAVIGEQLVENDETFFVNLSSATFDGVIDPSRALVQDNQGIGTILNDDAATIAISDFSHVEGDSASQNFVFTITLDAPVDADVTLDFATADATALAEDGDYLLATGALVFPASQGGLFVEGPLSQTVTVTVLGDAKVELDEQFLLNLSNLEASGRTVSYTRNQGQGAILNEDRATLAIGDAQQNEGDAGATQMLFPVMLDAALDRGISIQYTTADESATAADMDYAPVTGIVNFVGTAGETQWLTVTIHGDNQVEVDEQFHVNLYNLVAQGRAVTVANSQASGALFNDDAATLSLSPVTDLEAHGAFGFVVQLSNPVDTAVTALLTTADGTATASDNDYLPANQLVTLLPGEMNKVVSIAILDDNKVETDEEFTASLSNLDATQRNVTLGVVQAPGIISNDDGALLFVDDATAMEHEGVLLFTVTLSVESVFTVTAAYSTTDEVAQAGVDYSPVAALLSLPPGITSAVISVPMLDDGLAEENETMYLLLSNPVNATLAESRLIGVIVNEDATPLASGDAFTTTENSAFSLAAPGILQNDEDADGDVLSALLENTTSHGSLTLHADGSFVYTPTAGYFGADSFVYQASDGVNLSSPATVTLTIAPLMQISTSFTVGIAGIQPACTSNKQMQVPINTEVVYCYAVKNTGSVPFLTHRLVDSQLGVILDNFVYELLPGATFSTTATAMLSVSATSVATWTAMVDSMQLEISSAGQGAGEDAQYANTGEARATQATNVLISGPLDDQDHDSIPDNVEGAADADGDNAPNFLDVDADGDTIPDQVEGATDVDQDQTPNFLDLDSDSDMLTDQVEAGPNPNNPADNNHNGTADFLEALTITPTRYLYLPLMRR